MHSKIKIVGLPAFDSNYLWLIHNGTHAWAVDPGDAQVVLNALEALNLNLNGILITHHHGDHVGGIERLKSHYPDLAVIGPMSEAIKGLTIDAVDQSIYPLAGLSDDDRPISARCIHTPGHTLGHVVYWIDAHANLESTPRLFCGDTLFAAGCGRLFEGTAAQLMHSLNTLMQLPDSTLVYCAHEYTLANLQFAAAVEPDNLSVQQRLAKTKTMRLNNVATVPFVLGDERHSNPFLRTQHASLAQAIQQRAGNQSMSQLDVFTELRQWKNVY
jgi:hydroxyacylglutathione hydrolase